MDKIIRTIDMYDDIIDKPHHVSKTRPHMAMLDRAAQFAPFAALQGHDEACKECTRLTESRHELSDYEKDVLNNKFQIVMENIGSDVFFEFTYFVEDAKKEGGAYVTYQGAIKDVDLSKNIVVLRDYTHIPIRDIVDIRCEELENVEF